MDNPCAGGDFRRVLLCRKQIQQDFQGENLGPTRAMVAQGQLYALADNRFHPRKGYQTFRAAGLACRQIPGS